MGQKWVKNAFFQTSSWTIWGAQTGKMSPFGAHFGAFWPSKVQKALKVGLVVMGFTCKLISLCQEPSMCESFLMSLTSHS